MKSKIAKSFLLLISAITLSCTENSKSNSSESELINRVNDVMEQMAIQGNISEEEKQAIISLANLVQDENEASSHEAVKDAIPYDKVEVKPVYVSCKEETSQNCFKEKLSALIEREFNKGLLNNTEIEAETTIEYFILINKEGRITNRKIREDNVVILAELARVLKLIPQMKPGFQDGKPVDVEYAGTFTYGGK